jgi:hypothetical protein
MIDRWINDCEKNMSREAIDIKSETDKSQFITSSNTQKTEGYLKNNLLT